MIGFSFKVNKMHVYLVGKLNPNKITATPKRICGADISISNGADTIYYIICNDDGRLVHHSFIIA